MPSNHAAWAIGEGRVGRARIIALGAGLLSLLAAGCSAPPPTEEEEFRRSPPEEILSWTQFQVGPHKGYIKEVAQRTGSIHWVYSGEWILLGYYTPMGHTFRVLKKADSELLGKYEPDDSLRALHGIDSLSVPVERSPMGEPLTLEKLEELERAEGEKTGSDEETDGS